MAPPRPVEADWLRIAFCEKSVAEVLNRLRAELNWWDLYLAYEVVRSEMKSEPRWPKTKAGFFQTGAQVFRHHGYAYAGLTPETAMPIEDARAFMRDLVKLWLDWKVSKL